MKIETKALLVTAIIIFALTLPVLAQSQCLTDVSTSASTSRSTTGTSVTITVTTTGSSCTVSTLSLVSSPSLTVNDPAGGQYSGFSAGTTKSFTVTAGTSGTYTYYARGTTSAGSVDSSQQILDFISPSDLTVTASPSSASVAQGNTFSLSVGVQNPQSSDVTTSYTLNLPSGLTRQSGDPASSSGTTVSASSTKTLSFTINHSTCFTGSKTITFDLGSSTGVASVSVTGNSTCDTGTTTTTTTTTSSGGGGTSATVTAEVHTFSVITPGAASIKKFTNTALGLKEISISVNSPANNVKITVTKLSAQPASVTKSVSGTVFQYLEINASNLPSSDIAAAKLTFEVTKGWLLQNGFNESEVVLQRYTGSVWEKLTTTKVSSDSNNVRYEALTSGFSVFVITAEKTAAVAPAPTPSPAPTPEEQPAEQPAPTPEEQPAAPAQPPERITTPGGVDIIYLVVIVIIIIAAGVYYFYSAHKRESWSRK